MRDELQEDSKPKPAKKKPRVVIANVNSDDSSDDSEVMICRIRCFDIVLNLYQSHALIGTRLRYVVAPY